MKHDFSWFNLVPGLRDLPNHSVTATFVALLLILMAIIFYRVTKQTPKDSLVVPRPNLGLLNLFEAFAEFICSLMDDIIGPEGRKFFPIIGTVFLFIFISNLIGIIPGFLPPTGNININAACAIFIFIFLKE